MRLIHQALLSVGIALIANACAQEQKVEYAEEDSEDDGSEDEPERRTFNYSAVVSDSSSLSLAANATAYSITLSGCASTQSATVDETKGFLELYEFDRNCLAKLTTFSLNGKTYTPKAGSLFDTWQVGDRAVFEVNGANPVDELNVEVIETVANPVVAGGTIHYQFSEITVGDTETLGEAVVRESQELVVNGQAAPAFVINQIEFVGINADGNGEFRFQLECDGQAVSGTGNSIQCYDVLLSSITMVLVKDTYGGVLTESDMTTIFAAETARAIDMSTDAFEATQGTPALANGGFITADTGDADVMVMSGVKPIVSNPNMIFILKSGPSYTYYNIDVTTITQSNDGP